MFEIRTSAVHSMPDLTLTEDQAMLQELAKEFAAETVTPNAATWEEGAIFPMDAIREAHDPACSL